MTTSELPRRDEVRVLVKSVRERLAGCHALGLLGDHAEAQALREALLAELAGHSPARLVAMGSYLRGSMGEAVAREILGGRVEISARQPQSTLVWAVCALLDQQARRDARQLVVKTSAWLDALPLVAELAPVRFPCVDPWQCEREYGRWRHEFNGGRDVERVPGVCVQCGGTLPSGGVQ